MTRDEAKKALEDARRAKPEVRKVVFTPAFYDAQKRYVWEARTERGEGLAGMWTELAGEVADLVAYGVLTKQNWRSYFHSCQPAIEAGMRRYGDPEGIFRASDPDQINTCVNGLAKLIAVMP